jgi:hypothetical protein
MTRVIKADCLRCESVGRIPPNLGHIPMIGPNGIDTVVCQECLDELKEEGNVYNVLDFENQENKKIS